MGTDFGTQNGDRFRYPKIGPHTHRLHARWPEINTALGSENWANVKRLASWLKQLAITKVDALATRPRNGAAMR